MKQLTATDFPRLLKLLVENGVTFIVVGGVAGNLHGVARVTYDLDVVYQRTGENIRRLAHALANHSPYLRGAPPDLPFRWDERTISAGLNFTLTTDLGNVDFLGEIAGGGSYEQLLPYTESMEAYGVNCRCLSLEKLIMVKRAAGRPKDFEAIAELEALLEERPASGFEPPS